LSGSRAVEHPLRAEFARIKDYLALMQVRMDDRLKTRFELPDSLAEIPVPPLLLQPIVENCIKHGLEPALAGGLIDVRAMRDDHSLVLCVRDTGVGLRDAPSRGTNFGLEQVRERLATLYGSKASLILEQVADPDGGTLATIRLPLPVE
jgi:LytS/YehU family sensor histidine kinase